MSNSRLTDGLIPAHTECPFKLECEIDACGKCNHKGKAHNCSYSCAIARGFDLTQRYEVVK